MWYLITAILSGAVGAFLMGLVAGAKLNDECRRAYEAGKAEMEEKKPRIVWDENGLTLHADDGMPLPQITWRWNTWREEQKQKSYADWELRRE